MSNLYRYILTISDHRRNLASTINLIIVVLCAMFILIFNLWVIVTATVVHIIRGRRKDVYRVFVAGQKL